ncbi:MAG: type II CAAX endopeptidase family protein [Anaerolineae bacterium]|jgi:membrane protease YdiL (CAAX protease family)
MNEKSERPSAEQEPPAFSRIQLVLYPLLVIGLFFATSLVIGLAVQRGIFRQGALWLALLAYALNFALFAGGAFLLAVRPGKLTWAELGIAPPRWRWLWLLLAVGVTLILLPLRGLIGVIVQQWLGGGLEAMQSRLDLLLGSELSWPRFFVTLLGAGLLAPVAEELFFRGFLYTALRQRLGIAAAVTISSLVFAIGHIDALGVVAASFIIGIALALAYEYTRSLWVAIAIHAFNNSLATVLVYLLMLVQAYLQGQGIDPTLWTSPLPVPTPWNSPLPFPP